MFGLRLQHQSLGISLLESHTSARNFLTPRSFLILNEQPPHNIRIALVKRQATGKTPSL